MNAQRIAAAAERRAAVIAVVLLVVLTVAYPFLAEREAHPLSVFVLPILVVAALGTATATAAVAAAAVAIAVVQAVATDLRGGPLAIRILVVVLSAIGGVFVARDRERRVRREREAMEARLRVARAMHVGRVGLWSWDSASGRVDWDDDTHALYGLGPGEFEGTFDGWVSRIHPSDRDRVLGVLGAATEAAGTFRYDFRCVWPDGSIHWIHGAGEVHAADGVAVGGSGVAISIDDQVRLVEVERATLQRSRYLQRTNRALVESLDLETVMDRVTAAAVPELGDWCSLVVTADRPPDAPSMSVAHEDPAMVDYARQLQARFPYDPNGPTGIPAVVRTGQPELVERITPEMLDALDLDPEVRDIVTALDLSSSLTVPLSGGLGRLGALQLIRSSQRSGFGAADMQLAEDLGTTIGAALNNALLFERERAAQRLLAGLQQLTARLADTSAVSDICERVVDSGAQLLHAHKALVFLAENGKLHLAAGTGYDDALLDPWREVGLDVDAPVTDVVRTRSPLVLSSRRAIEARYPFMVGSGAADQAMVITPLVLRQRMIGALFFAWDHPHAPSPLELGTIETIAGRCAGAVERARLYEREKAIATTLQRSLLPSVLRAPSWLAATSRYWAAEDGAEVGGDFFDLFAVGDDRWAVTIGDVCGKGVEAAALTSVARHTARAAARHAATAADVLIAVHEAVAAYDGTNYCTMAFGFVERGDEGATLSIALGGHPRPLVRRADGSVTEVGRPGTLLGIIEPRAADEQVQLAPGDTLVLYTDGVTDAPRGLAVSTVELAAAVAGAGGGAEEVAEEIGALLAQRRPHGVDDDVALLVVGVPAEVRAEVAPDEAAAPRVDAIPG